MNSVSNVENLSPQIIRRIVKEMHEISTCSPEGIKLQINDADVTDIQAVLEGPPGTPYAGGSFRIKLNLGKHFPTSPPKAYFLTKIFHPNVAANGEICVNTLKKDWTPDLGIKHILLTIKCLLIVPNPESALNEEAGKLLLEQYDDYCRRAKMMTEIHAPPILKSGKSTTDADDQQQQQQQQQQTQTQQSGKWTTNNSINNNSNNINNNTINSISNNSNNSNISNNSLNINNNLNNINNINNNNITNITNNSNNTNNNNNTNTESSSTINGDDGPLMKKHAVDLKRLQDKKKEKLLKEKKRNLKRL